MKKVNHKDIEATSPTGTKGIDFKQMIAKNMEAPHFYMRLIDLFPGGHTERHTHEWEHEVFVVEGSGKVALKNREEDIVQGDAIFIEPNEIHEFVNSSNSLLRVICVIPRPPED
ncbi:MAG: cupin domain-containing protein [Candidatus Thermoplasmatota archaeon]|nr:cupin domain-containing protein [Candidatus Thermoplasmatota archaeon]